MKNSIIYRQQGFSLVELLVGMVLGLFLMLGIGQLYIANSSSFRAQEGLAKIQEGGRFAMQRISSSVRSAGFFGCAGLSGSAAIIPKVLASPVSTGLNSITTDTPIFGDDDVAMGTTVVNGFNTNELVAGSDTLTLRGSGASGIAFTGIAITPDQDVPIASGNESFVEEDIVLITDCAVADLFRATSVTSAPSVTHKTTCTTSGNPCNTRATLSKLYGADAMVVHPYVNTFFVADSGRTNHQGNAVMSLYLQDMSGNAIELVEGVSDFQVRYGVDTNNDKVAERYMDADEITTASNWGGVVSVRVSLLVDSIDAATNTPADYTFQDPGTLITSNDRLLRKEFTGLFTLRNRVL